MNQQFPRTTVGGVSVSRLVIGTNWMLGWSHTGAAADAAIRERYMKPEDFYPILHTYAQYGIDTILGPISEQPHGLAGIRYTEQKDGIKFHIIDTPNLNVDDNPQARAEALAAVKKSAACGCEFCFPHHVSVEQLVNKNIQQIPRLPDYLAMIRDEGMIPGLSAHMPECVLYSDLNEYDVESYIQSFNCMGFMMQMEIETVARIIHEAKKPVLTIKPYAAGRTTPYVGSMFTWNAIRPIDMVACGATTALEAEEDIEYALAAIEHRFPNVEGRGSSGKRVGAQA